MSYLTIMPSEWRAKQFQIVTRIYVDFIKQVARSYLRWTSRAWSVKEIHVKSGDDLKTQA